MKKREIYESDLGENEGCDPKVLESWGCKKKPIAILGNRNWPEQARVDVDRISETFL